MPPEKKTVLDAHVVEMQRDRLLLSETFKTSPRLREFLQLTTSLTLVGRESEINQFLIATEVFKRPAELFDPQIDPIVRVEAARLRAKLREYYDVEGPDDAILIQYPKGTYIPSFENRAPGNRTPSGQATQPFGPLVNEAATGAPGGRLRRIAVLPFRNLGSRRNLAYLGEAVAAQLINRLAGLSRIRVVSQTSSFQYIGEDRDIRIIGRELGVDAVIDGCVRSVGRGLRVTSQINDTSTGYLVWSEVLDWLTKDTLAMQEEVARTVAMVVETLCPEEERPMSGRKLGNAAFFEAAPQLS